MNVHDVEAVSAAKMLRVSLGVALTCGLLAGCSGSDAGGPADPAVADTGTDGATLDGTAQDGPPDGDTAPDARAPDTTVADSALDATNDDAGAEVIVDAIDAAEVREDAAAEAADATPCTLAGITPTGSEVLRCGGSFMTVTCQTGVARCDFTIGDATTACDCHIDAGAVDCAAACTHYLHELCPESCP